MFPADPTGFVTVDPLIRSTGLPEQQRRGSRNRAARSHHRGASIPDRLIAACADAQRITVLHYDADYDLILPMKALLNNPSLASTTQTSGLASPVSDDRASHRG